MSIGSSIVLRIDVMVWCVVWCWDGVLLVLMVMTGPATHFFDGVFEVCRV